MRLSVIIPVHSEEDILREVVEGLVERTRQSLEQVILVVSPRSTPRTVAICEQLTRAHPCVTYVLQRHNPGLGRAYREAFPLVTGTHVAVLDADGEMDLETLPNMMRAAAQGYDLVLASRWMPGSRVYGYDPVTYVLNRGFQYLFRVLFWTRVRDLTYGFKLFNARLLREVRWWGTLHEIAMETTLKPLKLGYRVCEVPTVWRRRAEGVSKSGVWKRLRYVPFAFRILLTPRRHL